MEAKKSSNVVVAYNLAGKFILNGINFLVVSVFTRLLGTENFGLFSLYITWESIAVIFVGMQTQSIIGNVTIKYGKEKRAEFLSSNVIFCAIIAIAIFTIITLFKNSISCFIGLPYPIILFMILHAFTNYGCNVVMGCWSFDLEAKRTFWVSLLLSLANIVLSLYLIININEYTQKYIGRIVGSAIPTILFGAGSLVYLIRKGKIFFCKDYLKYTLSFAIPIVCHALSTLILSQSDRIMLQKMGSISDVGVYSILFTLNNLLIILMEAFNSAWVPYFYSDMKEERINDVKIKTKNYIWIYTCLVLGFILLSPEVLYYFAGEDFIYCEKSIAFLSIGSYFVFLYSFSVNYKYYKAETQSIAVGTIGAGVINIALNFALIPILGIYGASLATAVSYFALWLFHHIGAKKIGNGEYPYKIKDFLLPICCVLCISLVCYTVLYKFSVIRWGLGILIGVMGLRAVMKRRSIW